MEDHVKWVFESLEYVINEIANQTQLYLNGIFKEPVKVRGVDIGHEIMRVRGGALINELSARMELKLHCIKNYEEEKCSWIKPLKYYAYSVHDSTLFQFFAILGMEERMDRVYPKNAAAAILEFYINNFDDRKYFRLLYRPDDESDFDPVTKEIPGCMKDYCDIAVFKRIAAEFNPNMTMEEQVVNESRVHNNSVYSPHSLASHALCYELVH
ncbi:hypothetical protein OESDEN_05304 [Oesophagostomum dentatum]|uniref:Histidine acid phosphatase n=1 Tax=Oesophagostomum dentatum TaxID=61180 RepID=A0A0B1TB38_OESDE|nr:hypothetical protein OESDEN_05304 [Oesophagostomum dentatum]